MVWSFCDLHYGSLGRFCPHPVSGIRFARYQCPGSQVSCSLGNEVGSSGRDSSLPRPCWRSAQNDWTATKNRVNYDVFALDETSLQFVLFFFLVSYSPFCQSACLLKKIMRTSAPFNFKEMVKEESEKVREAFKNSHCLIGFALERSLSALLIMTIQSARECVCKDRMAMMTKENISGTTESPAKKQIQKKCCQIVVVRTTAKLRR